MKILTRKWTSLNWLHQSQNSGPIVTRPAAIIVVGLLTLLLNLSSSRRSHHQTEALDFGYLVATDNRGVGGIDAASGADPRTVYQVGGNSGNDAADDDDDDSGGGAHWVVARSKLFANSEIVQGAGFGDDNDNNAGESADDDNENADQEAASFGGSWSLPRAPLAIGEGQSLRTNQGIYLLEDKDYPKSLFEDYPRRVGQVSGITTLPNKDVVIFHRSERQWTERTFNESDRRRVPDGQQENLIRNDTIMIIDGEDGSSVASFGSNLFYMPHSIASDPLGNLWVSDVARHQVMRLPATNIREVTERVQNGTGGGGARHQVWPDIILGEAFVPGSDGAHFCQPSEIAVSSDGRLVFVADGYCNRRVMVFAGATGKFIKSFGQLDNLRVVHSLTLFEEKNLLCVADREGARILCYNAGLDGDLARLGEPHSRVAHPLGRVFAIASISPDHLLVSSNQFDTNRYDMSIVNPFTHEMKLVWISSDLLEPHSLTTTRDREHVYAADVSKEAYKKVFKFDVIRRGI